MDLKYRFEQFWQLVHATPLSTAAWQAIGQILTPAEEELFRRYTAADRQHAYRVLTTLQQAGDEHPLSRSPLTRRGQNALSPAPLGTDCGGTG